MSAQTKTLRKLYTPDEAACILADDVLLSHGIEGTEADRITMLVFTGMKDGELAATCIRVEVEVEE